MIYPSVMIEVEIEELLANPNEFHKRTISVCGYGVHRRWYRAIYPSLDYLHLDPDPEKGIWVIGARLGMPKEKEEVGLLHGRHVRIIGKFEAKQEPKEGEKIIVHQLHEEGEEPPDHPALRNHPWKGSVFKRQLEWLDEEEE